MTTMELEGVRVRDVRAISEPLRALVTTFDADAVFVFDAPALWEAFDVIERLALSAKTLLARRVEDACTWRSAGFRSAADQLATLSGTSLGSAKAALETSRQLADLPATASAVRLGGLSGPKVQVLAAAAAIAPDAECELLTSAVAAPLGEVRAHCQRARFQVDPEGAHERIRKDRYLRDHPDAEGAWNVHGRGTLEAGAEVRAALDPIVNELFEAARAEGRKEPREAYAFDALLELARRSLGLVPDRGEAPKRKTTRSFIGLIRVDLEALRRGWVEGHEVCELPGLGPIPVSVARDLLGDAVLKLVITKGVDVVNVTHLGRSATVAQKIAVWWQSPTCRVKGCTRTQRLQIDHRYGWANTRRTKLDGLDRLCEHHHNLKTREGWELAVGDGPQPMVPPDDPRHPIGRAPPIP